MSFLCLWELFSSFCLICLFLFSLLLPLLLFLLHVLVVVLLLLPLRLVLLLSVLLSLLLCRLLLVFLLFLFAILLSGMVILEFNRGLSRASVAFLNRAVSRLMPIIILLCFRDALRTGAKQRYKHRGSRKHSRSKLGQRVRFK